MFTRVVAGASSVIVAASAVFLSAPSALADPGILDAPTVPIVRTDGGVALPTSYPVQPTLTEVPADPTDASLFRGAVPYADIAPKVNDLMAESEYVSAQVIGQSEQGRDLYLVTVTAPETAEETAQQTAWRDAIKHTPGVAAESAAIADGYKLPIWFNSNIHGNEWEGTDATLNYIEQLVDTSGEPEVKELLETTRLYFTVSANPDGRFNGTRATANGYDPNRDFITNATNTTTALRDITGRIQPTYFVDLHGYTGILQVEPCGPPHGENYEYDLFLPHAYSAALAVEEAVAEADIPGNTYDDGAGNPTTTNTGKILIPYRDIREGWDDWPPIFAPQYVAYQGAITNTVELPLGRSNDPETSKKNSAIDTEVAEVVIDSIIEYVVDNRDPLLANQIEIFDRGVTGAEQTPIPADVAPEDLAPGVPTEWTDIWDETDIYNATFPRAYVIPVDGSQRSRSDAEQLVEQLLVNDVEVTRATAPFTADGTTYPAGTFLVDMHQPLRGLANVLLADGTDISDRISEMYDISAWSLSLLWGADVVSVGDTTDAAVTVAVEPVTEVDLGGSVADGGPYLALEPAGTAEWQAVTALLDAGIPLSQLEDGTVVLGKDAASRAAAEEAASLFGVDFTATDGLALREESTTSLRSLSVGYTTTDDRDVLLKLGFDEPVLVSAALVTSGAVDLSTLDVLFLGGNLSFTGQNAAGAEKLTAYLAAGGDVVARGSGGATFANTNGLAQVTATTGTSGSNGIVRVDTPEGSVFGPDTADTAFIYPATWFVGLGDDVTVEQSYASDVFVSGHWATSDGRSPADAAGQASAISSETEAGSRFFLFGTSPTFRNHPVGQFGDIASALYWSAGPGTAVVPPITEEDLTEDTRGGVSVPAEATAGDTITVTVDASLAEQELTATLFSEPVGLGTHVVSAAGTFEVTIPADTTAAVHRVAVEDATGALIGWDDLTVLAAEVPGEEPGTGEPGTGEPGAGDPGDGAAGPGEGVAVTGANDALPVIGLASALLLFGACLVVAKRMRRASEGVTEE
ncbi:zinc carboxypeptidase [Labedella gwakjiensis]|uniref:Zinc carboxypeptidase n=2 Tax=Labedella gwakjiensis TaxID=390269 RepID=A0A2P8GWI3_9MICO|nr:M14 family zinc carboxypeptidase [Labedella gwakjiensis]PSL38323.1 zinc carboxypeptidase [Labedella gwakjiensis]